MSSATDYFMNDTREAKRLADKVDAEAWVSRYLTPHLNGSARLLDVGCGPGVLAETSGKAHPELSVIGVDLSSERFQATQSRLPSNVQLRIGDAHVLEFPDRSFDFIYCRFLLQYLAEREQAVREMVRVCTPGGRVMLQDLDGQLVWQYPEDEQLKSQVNCVLAGLVKTGFDPFVGRKLFSIVKSAGLEDIQVTAESYHLFAGQIDEHNYRLWETKLDIAMPAAAKVLGSDKAARTLKDRFLDHLRREDTLTYSVVFTVIGTKPTMDQRG